MVSTTTEPTGGSGYPVRYELEYPEQLSRWLIFVKWLLAIPHFIILYFLQIAFGLITFIAFFIILFTKKYPEGLFKFAVGVRRWTQNVYAYIYLLRDEYPPFTLDAGNYALDFQVEYPQELSRWLIFVKWLLVIPHLIIVSVLTFVVFLLVIIAFFAILFTRTYPHSMFDFVVGTMRWMERMYAYAYLMRDEYPPFSLQP